MAMAAVTSRTGVAERPRAFVAVSGPQAADFLQRMLSNDVAALPEGGSCDALLLTPKARVIAVARVLRRGPEDFLLLVEPSHGDVLRDALLRMRFAARCDVVLEEHPSYLAFGEVSVPPGVWSLPNRDYGSEPCTEIVGAVPPSDLPRLDLDLERLRIEAGTPMIGKEIDDRVMPAEVGLDERAISFTKGCYPGQEPVARLRYRGHVNRLLRVVRIETGSVPAADADVVWDGKAVGRITSAAAAGSGVVALALVRVEVPDDAKLTVDGAVATMG